MTPGAVLFRHTKHRPPSTRCRPVAFGQELFVAETVLQGEQHRVRPEQRGKQRGQRVVGGRLDGDQDEVAGADGVGRGVDVGLRHAEIALAALDPQPETAHRRAFLLRADEEMHLASVVRQLRPVEPAHRTGAHDGDAVARKDMRGRLHSSARQGRGRSRTPKWSPPLATGSSVPQGIALSRLASNGMCLEQWMYASSTCTTTQRSGRRPGVSAMASRDRFAQGGVAVGEHPGVFDDARLAVDVAADRRAEEIHEQTVRRARSRKGCRDWP